MRNVHGRTEPVLADDEDRAREAIETLIARLQRIARLEVEAQQAIEAAEAALDSSLRACPALERPGSLYDLRKLN
ncbi:MAG: hypothetical protein NW223_18195 [Hyphomicrobiaceae bacterium]|nr:hypothetical protein [Hyphomicrobiaceae bacterium]